MLATLWVLGFLALLAGRQALLQKPLLASPFRGISDEQWSRFEKLMRGKSPTEVTESNCLGLYNFSYLRLRQLGLAVDVSAVKGPHRTVWIGRMKPPLTLAGFLQNAKLQYAVFVRDVSIRMELIAPFVGREVDGIVSTKSGLLAVAKLTGEKGFLAWIEDPTERQKHKQASAAFRLVNGIF